MIELPGCDLGQIRNMMLTQIIIDLESEEVPLRKEIFEKYVATIESIPYS